MCHSRIFIGNSAYFITIIILDDNAVHLVVYVNRITVFIGFYLVNCYKVFGIDDFRIFSRTRRQIYAVCLYGLQVHIRLCIGFFFFCGILPQSRLYCNIMLSHGNYLVIFITVYCESHVGEHTCFINA